MSEACFPPTIFFLSKNTKPFWKYEQDQLLDKRNGIMVWFKCFYGNIVVKYPPCPLTFVISRTVMFWSVCLLLSKIWGRRTLFRLNLFLTLCTNLHCLFSAEAQYSQIPSPSPPLSTSNGPSKLFTKCIDCSYTNTHPHTQTPHPHKLHLQEVN